MLKEGDVGASLANTETIGTFFSPQRKIDSS